MRFKTFLEAVIVPDKIRITTTDIKKLNNQFKNTNITFDYDTGEHAAYHPNLGTITVYITKETPFHIIEALLQHELIHQVQDIKSGRRMQADIERQYAIVQGYLEELEQFKDDEIDDLIAADLMDKINKARIKAQHLNDEERMTYAMMFVKLRSSDNIKSVLKEADKHWRQFTGVGLDKKIMKYFYSYWLVKNEL